MKRYGKMEEPTAVKKCWRRLVQRNEKPKVTMVEKGACGDTNSVRRYKVRHLRSEDGSSKYCGWKLFGMRKEPEEQIRG